MYIRVHGHPDMSLEGYDDTLWARSKITVVSLLYISANDPEVDNPQRVGKSCH